MNVSKSIILAAIFALIASPLFFVSSDVEAATTGKRSKSSKSRSKSKSSRSKSKSKRTPRAKSKSKRTHRLNKKTKNSATNRRRATTNTGNRNRATTNTRTRNRATTNSHNRNRARTNRTRRRVTTSPEHRTTVTRTTRTRSNGHTTVRRTNRDRHGSRVRRRTVVRNNGHHVSTYRSQTVHRHTSSCMHDSHNTVTYRAPRRTVVHQSAPARRTVVYQETATEVDTIRPSSPPIEFYVNGGLGMNSLSISDVSEGSLSGTNYRVAIGGKGELFGMELGIDGGSFAFDDGTTLSMVGVNVDAKLQPKFGILEPYVFVGIGGYQLRDNVFDEEAGSGALRAGLGADVRINNVGIGAKYTWAAYDFQNDQSYVNVGATTQTLSGNLSFYF